jgi:DNA-binding NtrC family response regulator
MRLDEEVNVSDLVQAEPHQTEQLVPAAGAGRTVRRFEMLGIDGPDAGKSWSISSERTSIGSHASNDLVLGDGAVSRFHCEVKVDDSGAWLRDLGSSNGTLLDGVSVREAALRADSVIRVGRTTLRFRLGTEQAPLPLSKHDEFGSLVGVSVRMRASFALLERAAQSDVTTLIEGETGTGKEGAAESIHAASARRGKPFLVVDCGAIPENLLESELFGHERGSFTGAIAKRTGVFEEADGGTVFLDEIGELSPELQPRLLRVLEQREIRRIGSNAYRPVNVRVVAATNRDLRTLVNSGAFRPDLYYRLAVLRVLLPPLRERPEDIPALVARFLRQLGTNREQASRLSDGTFLARLQAAAWPGNVRELRNYVERCIVLDQHAPLGDDSVTAPSEAAAGTPNALTVAVDPAVSYSELKRRVLDDFERRYLTLLLARHEGNVSAAARAAGMDRVHVYKLLHRHGLRR